MVMTHGMLDILRHWNPEIRKSEHNHKVYVAGYCPICKYHNLFGRHFRYNIKLGVIKCYNCGAGARNIESLLYQIKLGYPYSKVFDRDFRRYKAKRKQSSENNEFEKVSRCESEYESTLPF